MVHPDLEVVTKTRIVMVIEQHSLLACVAIPPLVLGLDVDVVPVVAASLEALAHSWGPPYPYALCCCCRLRLTSRKFECVDVLLEVEVLLGGRRRRGRLAPPPSQEAPCCVASCRQPCSGGLA